MALPKETYDESAVCQSDHLEDEQMRKIDFHTDATQEFRQRIAKHLVVLSYGEDHPRNP